MARATFCGTRGLSSRTLGARDVLRLEAGMPLYGHELEEDISPLSAGLDWVVKLGKQFRGRDALLPRIQGLLRELRIFSRGRFGGWRYEISNQDHAFMQGVEIVSYLVLGDPETTYV